VASPRKTTRSSAGDKTGSSRSLTVPVLIILAIAVVVAFAMTKRSSKQPATPAPSATPSAPPYQSPPPFKPPQTYTPSPKVQTAPPPASAQPPAASAPQSMNTRAIPAEFLKAFQEYATKSGGKAMALAVDSNGRYAYASISGMSTQSDASAEALSDCTRFKTQSGIQENCKLYAVGDKVVWFDN
jgi:adenylate cyclase